jgi:hypothetical protein
VRRFYGTLIALHTLKWPDPLLAYSPDDQGAFQAALNFVVAAERALDGPDGLSDGTTAQIGIYVHLGRGGRTS